MSQDASPGIANGLTTLRENSQSAQDWCPGLLSASLVQVRFLEDEESLMAAGETAGPSTTLRYGPSTSGRDDDNSVAGSTTVPSHLFRSLQNCHPDRSVAKWRDLRFLPRP